MAKFNVPANLFRPKLASDIPTPFDPAELKRTEKALGVTLPAALVEVLKVRNGGLLRLTQFPLKAKPPRKMDYISGRAYHVDSLPGVHPKHPNGLTQLTKTARGWEVEEGLFPLDGDGHHWLCLDYRTSGPRGEPTITHWEQGDPRVDAKDPSNPTCPVAESFAALILGLRRAKDDFQPAAIALDHETVRGKQLAAILEKLGCEEHSWAGVKSRTPLPPTWRWPKYKSFVRGLTASVAVEQNKTYGFWPKFDQRPAGHPILCVSVRLQDETKCLAELTAALGAHAQLLQHVT
jgi:hypothetical protein